MYISNIRVLPPWYYNYNIINFKVIRYEFNAYLIILLYSYIYVYIRIFDYFIQITVSIYVGK